MSKNKTRRRSGLCLLMLMALVLVTLPVAPATADHSPPPGSPVDGSGTLHGTELAEYQTFLGQPCFAASKHVFGLRGEGTYFGYDAEGQKVLYQAELDEGQPMYEGPLHFEVENTEPFHHGPYGTHGGDSSCSTATAGTPVPANFRICSPRPLTYIELGQPLDQCTAADHIYRVDDSGARLPCTGKGSWVRKGDWSQENWHADWTLDADCVVVGNQPGTPPGQGVARAGTVHTHRGVSAPCFGGGCVDNFKLDYAQHPPVPGLALSMGGPTGAPIGQTVTLTAGVTDDGVPLAGAPVAFSVAGPGPGAPPAETIPTGTDGRADFTFTAAVEGDYVVTASTTWPTYPGEVASDTHTVHFSVPAPRMTLGGLARSATEDPLTVTATIVDENNPVPGDPQHDPVPGVTVDFAVTVDPAAGPAQATPASGSATTDLYGRASFTFAGDRAGDYTVTASATYAGRDLSATHTVNLDVKTLSRVGALDDTSSSRFTSAVVDPAGHFAYFGSGSPGLVAKVELRTFERVGTITLPGGEHSLTSAVIDPAGDFAYFGTGTFPGRVVKVDLATFERVGTITLGEGENTLTSAVMDPAGDFAYFGTDTSPGRVVKIDLNMFQRVGAITLGQGESKLTSAVIDPAGEFAYFGSGAYPGPVVKVDLANFERVAAAAALDDFEGGLGSAVMDPAGEFAYFGGRGQYQSRLIKFDLATFQRVGTIELPTNVTNLTSAVIDPAGTHAYFGALIHDAMDYFRYSFFPSVGELVNLVYSLPTSDGVLKVDLDRFELAHVLPLAGGEEDLTSAVIDPAGTHAYFGTTAFRGSPLHKEDDLPAKVVKLSLTRPPKAALAAAADSYATPYLTPLPVAAPGVLGNDRDTEDDDPLTAHDASDPANGSVALKADGSFTYTPDRGFSGTDTFTYVASDGMDYSAPATVTVTVAPRPEWHVASVTGSAYGYHSNVSLFGGPYGQRGPAPTVALSPDAANSPQDAHVDTAEAVYGPAVIFKSGPIDVHAEGALGGAGYASASSTVHGHPDPAQRPGPFLYDQVSSACTADEAETPPAVSVTNGVVETSYHVGDDPNTPEVEEGGDVKTTQAVPGNPPPGYTIEGTIDHVGDRFRIVFNEQTTGPDGSLTVNAAHMELLGPTAVGDLFIARSTCGVALDAAPKVAPVADFDGDADTDISVFRPSSGAWYIQGRPTTYHGRDGDAAVPADYDGDSDSDVAVFRPANGGWYVQGQPTVYHGRNGDLPVPADYDGDGDADIAVFRPSSGGWYIAGQAPVFFGRDGDIPVPGYYDADPEVDLAVFRPSVGAWYVQGQPTAYFGRNGDVPVPADYDGDGDDDIAVFRPSVGAWYVQGQPTAYLGRNGDVPVPADYAGDGTADIAVFRPSVGAWYVQGSPTVYFGRSGDAPLPLPHAIHQAFF